MPQQPLKQEPEVPNFNLVENKGITKDELVRLQKKIQIPILRHSGQNTDGTTRTPEQNAGILSQYMWIGILDDLLDSKIALNTFHSGGHLNGDRRIDLTRAYFGEYLRKFDMDGIIDFVNLVHELNGVTERDEKGIPRTTKHYEESFMYVLSSLIERMRDFYRDELDTPKDSPKGREVGENLCNLWYGVAQRVGLRQRPATLDDHDAFVQAHEAQIIPEIEKNRDLQTKIQGMARRFMPRIAKLSTCSEADVAARIMKVRPKLGSLLAIDKQEWSNEVQHGKPAVPGDEGSKTDDATLKALWDAGQKTYDTSIRVIYHLATRLRPNMALEPIVKRELQPGEALIEQGKPADYLYVLLNTDAPLDVVQTVDNQKFSLAKIEPGMPTILGETGMLDGGQIDATVQAGQQATKVELLRISREQFQEIMQDEDGRLLKQSLFPLKQKHFHDYQLQREAQSGR